MPALTGPYVTLDQLIELAVTAKAKFEKRKGAGLQSGKVLSKIRGRGLDFDEVRQYHSGDDVRNIDWKVTARLQKPHTKVFREEQERPCLFISDQSQSMFFGSQFRLKSVLSAEVLTRLAWSALVNRDRVGGIVIGNTGLQVTRPRRSNRTVARLLHDLASTNQELSTQAKPVDMAETWHQLPYVLRRLTTSNYSLTFISDFARVDRETWLKILSFNQHNLVRIIFTFDPLERELPPANDYSVSRESETIRFHSGIRQIRRSYQNLFEDRLEQLRKDCLQRNIPFIAVSTIDDLAQTLNNV